MKLQNAGMPHFGARYHARHLADAERIIEEKSHEGVDSVVVTDLNGVSVITNEGDLRHLDAFRYMAGERDGEPGEYSRTHKAQHFFASYPDEAVDTYVKGFMQEVYLYRPGGTDRRQK